MGTPDLTPEQFGGIQTKHGRVTNLDDGAWLVYGHVNEEQFIEVFNAANVELGTGDSIGVDEALATSQHWATLQSGDADDEWSIAWPIINTAETPGAFPVTVSEAL